MALLHFVLEAVPVFDGLDPVATEEGLRAALRSGLVLRAHELRCQLK